MAGRFEGKQALVARRREPALDRLGDREAARRRRRAASRSPTRASASRRTSASSPRPSTSPLVTECDVRSDDDIARVFAEVGEAFGGELDILVHSVAFAAAEDLEGRFTDTPRDRFWMARRRQRVLARRVRARGRAADGGARRRLDRDDDVPRRRARRAALQRDGRRQGDARLDVQLPRLGPRLEEHPRERDLRPARCARSRRARSPASRRWRRSFEERAPLHRQIDADDCRRRRRVPALGRRRERHRHDALRRRRVPRDGHVGVRGSCSGTGRARRSPRHRHHRILAELPRASGGRALLRADFEGVRLQPRSCRLVLRARVRPSSSWATRSCA